MILTATIKGKEIQIEIPDNEYWIERNKKRVSKYWFNADNVEKRMKKEYLRVYDELEKELYRFAGKYGEDGILTYSQNRVIVLMKEIKPKLDRLYEVQQTSLTDHLIETYNSNYFTGLYDLSVGTKVFSSFVGLNETAIKTAISYPWSGESFSDRIYNNKLKLVNSLKQEITSGLIRGDSIREMSSNIAKELDIAGKNAFRLIQTETGAVLNASDKKMYDDWGVDEYMFVATMDNRTSPQCKEADSHVFKVKEMITGVNSPPLHPLCFVEGAEIYTNNGWKDFRDLDYGDNCLSFNPDNQSENGFVKILNRVEYQYDGDVIKFSSKTLDITVTPNHKMLLKYNPNKKADWRFIDADKVPKWSNKMYRGLEWNDNKQKIIEFAGFEIETNLFCKFMAYYLADGSYHYDEKHKYHKCKITQTDKLELLYSELKELPFNVTRGVKEDIHFYDQKICKELSKYGKCNEKYIPQMIKDLGKEYLHTFLMAYAITDGNIKKGKDWKGGNFKDSITFMSTSKKIADDLGELILKVGGRPTFSLVKLKGKSCFNGKYKHNFDIWNIYWCNKVYSHTDTIKKEFIKYSGKVYCVELKKWNTILVRCNGKILWTGNCRSSTVPYFNYFIGKRISKDLETGKTKYINADIDYKTWEKRYIK